ncbi:uncharacterized protein N7479_009854 [Penicillium vulpinum]|uniref:uncharacterized protein n=1 Tax=Penicillium vulpinum TaxID=29845 RepID=UPI0025469282|nr:uncharacterized protein N7479_009854 [Penicillium vulpinum]KAJ5951441.1 hypothetical protein N7479_009854 [Penicillium vulpinum]
MIGMLREPKSHGASKDRKDRNPQGPQSTTRTWFHSTDAPDIYSPLMGPPPFPPTAIGPHKSSALSDPDP